jgi:acyl-CoA synthetase (NDP forming)
MSLDRVLRPKSVAIVGASPDRSKFGGKVMNFLRRHSYSGQVLPINPRYDEIDGWPCYPDIASIPADTQLDAVLVAVPRQQAGEVVRECGRRGAAVAVVFTSGFAEAGGIGDALQAELLSNAAENGVRVLGPNSFGFINFADRVTATPSITLSHGDMEAGPVGLVSHSGGVAMGSIYACARDRGVRFSYIVCPGNEGDVDAGEVIDFLLDDANTHVIAAVLEGVSDGRRLIKSLQRALAQNKPVIMLKVGRSEIGRQVALSHTAHMAGDDEIFSAVAAQHAVIRVDDYDELYLQAGLMARVTPAQKARVAASDGVAYISISGGIGAIVGDLAGVNGLPLARFSEGTIRGLQALLPDFQVATNPFDVGAVALTNPGVVASAIAIMAKDPGVGVIVPCITVAENYDSVLHSIANIRSEVPIAVLWAGKSFSGTGASILRDAQVPYFDTPTLMVKALARLFEHCVAVREAKLSAPPAEQLAATAIPVVPLKLAASVSSLNEAQSKDWLKSLGFPVVPGRLVSTEDDAVKASGEIGFPVVLKLVSTALAHKSDHGAVLLNQHNADQVRAAFRKLHDLAGRLGVPNDGILVEKMMPGAVEVVVGLKRDEQFGPVIMVGSGGVLVELLADISFLVPPFDERAVSAALKRTEALGVLLRGFRGKPEADRDALVNLLVKFGTLAQSLSDVADEIEMNPVLVLPKGEGAYIVDALVRLRSPSKAN